MKYPQDFSFDPINSGERRKTDNPRITLQAWLHYYEGKGMEELKQALLLTTLELQTTRSTTQEELRNREKHLFHLKGLLNKVVRERDEALEKYHNLLHETLLIKQPEQQQPASGTSSIEDDQHPQKPCIIDGFSSSDCEGSIVSSPANDPPATLPQSALWLIAGEKPLPEKGKLLQAVVKAGPLLQSLLLAGPLPQWRHPPPPLESVELPPVGIPAMNSPKVIHQKELLIHAASKCGAINSIRSYFGSDCGYSCHDGNKLQKLLFH